MCIIIVLSDSILGVSSLSAKKPNDLFIYFVEVTRIHDLNEYIYEYKYDCDVRFFANCSNCSTNTVANTTLPTANSTNKHATAAVE
jgi:hypothetical protein